MTTTELINLLKNVEFGASGKSREISFYIGETYIPSSSKISVYGTGDGIAGAELNLLIESIDNM